MLQCFLYGPLGCQRTNNRGKSSSSRASCTFCLRQSVPFFDTEEKKLALRPGGSLINCLNAVRPFYATTQTIIAADLVIRFLSCITRQNAPKTDRAQIISSAEVFILPFSPCLPTSPERALNSEDFSFSESSTKTSFMFFGVKHS